MENLVRRVDVRKVVAHILPYVIILGLSFAALYVYFYDGLLIGDDLHFHLANINDEYLSLLNDGSISRISTYLASNLGMGTRLFYSPLFHICASIIYFVTHGLDGNAVDAVKVVMFISVFVSGVFMYRFVFKASDGSMVAATIAAALYVLYPYRIFDALCRAAYAEALSFTFIPLFFMGLYGIVHFKTEIKVMPFIEIIIGGALLFLSHNLTAMFAFIFGIIYLLANGNRIAELCRKRRYWITGLISILLLVGLMSIQLFPTMELMNTGLYNISDRVKMWTTLSHVMSRVAGAFSYSGFLNYPYMNGTHGATMSASILTVQIIYFLFLTLLFFVLDKALGQIKQLKYFHFAISAAIYIGLMIALAWRIEVVLGSIVVVVLYFFVDYIAIRRQNPSEGRIKPIYQEIDFWFLCGIIVLIFILITQTWIWQIMPDPLLMIQFPWRLWAFIQFFASWLIGWLCHRLNTKKAVVYVATAAVGFCLVTNQALPEKRLLRELIENGQSTSTIYQGDDNHLSYNSSIGWNREYVPQVFSQSDYVSEYANTLYYAVRAKLKANFTDEYPFSPVVLEGDCLLDVTLAETPRYDLNLELTSESLIQMPLIYYPGYRVIAFDEQGTKTTREVINVDGLVAFNVDLGDDKVEVSYIGTPLTITSYVIFGLSILGTVALASVYGLVLNKKKKNNSELQAS